MSTSDAGVTRVDEASAAGLDGSAAYLPKMPRRALPHLRPAGLQRVRNRLERRRFLSVTPASTAMAPGSIELVRLRGVLRLVCTRPGIRPHEVQRDNLALVVDLCEAHGVEYFLVPGPVGRRARVAIPGPHWSRFVEALVEVGRTRPVYVGVAALDRSGSVRRWSELAGRPEVVRAARTQRMVEVFEFVCAAPGGHAMDRPYGCQVERWDSDQDGLHPPERNDRTGCVRPSGHSIVRRQVNGLEVATLEAFDPPSVFEVDFPVDVVYLWVDGADPAWQERHRAALAARGLAAPPPGAAAERFRDNGELRYSLRSINRHAPWVRHIYLVTDGQTPAWLDPMHPQITVVDHREIFASTSDLPTFNSHAIGARLHHIEGLSEQYLYLNDDVFLGRLVQPDLFFHSNGVAKFFLSRATLPVGTGPDASPHEQARRNVAELIHRDFGRLPTRTFFHTPIPQRRSVLAALEERYPEELRSTAASQFRTGTDFEVNSWLHGYFGYLQGATAPGRVRYDYFNLADETSWGRMERLQARRDFDTFCVNDSAEVTPEQHARAGEWLRAYFPEPAPWEHLPPAGFPEPR